MAKAQKVRKQYFIMPLIVVGVIGILVGGVYLSTRSAATSVPRESTNASDSEGGPKETAHPLSIQALRDGEYPGSDLVIEQTLAPGSNYQRFIASYRSEGLKIYGLLTIPTGEKPEKGWPTIIFNHGYIPPAQYVTTERYIAYTDAFSRNGYVLFRPDYRGHGNSEGQASGGYGSNGYTIDVLNALASVKRLKLPADLTPALSSDERENIVDTNRIGMWGHSMGGHITLRSMVVNKDIKAGVIWAGVVASYPDMLAKWRRNNSTTPSVFPTTSVRGGWRNSLTSQFGSPESNPEFWNAISSNSYLSDISGPLQIHHGTADTSVPYEFSETLEKQMKEAKKEVELFIYPGDDHDITNNFSTAITKSVEFFDTYLK